MTLDEARQCINRRVVYCPPQTKPELGWILSVGTDLVFVQYDGSALDHPKATRPEDLVLL